MCFNLSVYIFNLQTRHKFRCSLLFSVFTQNQVLKPHPGWWCSLGQALGPGLHRNICLIPPPGPQAASSSSSTGRAGADISVPSAQRPSEDLPRMADWGQNCWRVWAHPHSILPLTLRSGRPGHMPTSEAGASSVPTFPHN